MKVVGKNRKYSDSYSSLARSWYFPIFSVSLEFTLVLYETAINHLTQFFYYFRGILVTGPILRNTVNDWSSSRAKSKDSEC